MAEAVAAVGLVSAIASLVNYGFKVVKRLDEFNDVVNCLPESFSKVRAQLPLLLSVVENLDAQASSGELNTETTATLLPILEGLRREIAELDDALFKILPSAQASQKEKIRKAIRSIGIQKRLDEFRSSIQDYLSTLAAFQHTRHHDTLKSLMLLVQSRYADQQKQPNLCNRKPIWMVKYDSEGDFVGRDDLMRRLEFQIHEDDHRVALAGIGGVGKTRICIQYCYKFSQERQEAHVFWVHGGSRSRFENDYRTIARLLDLPGREDHDVDVLRLVADWFNYEANGSYLMVLDGADDRDIWLGPSTRSTKASASSMPLIDYLPRCANGYLLFTTRDRQLGHKLMKSKRQPLDVARLGAEESRSLLLAKLTTNEKLEQRDADELAKELEHLPLTITQAAAYLEQTEITASEYLEIFRAGLSDVPSLLEESIDDPGRDREGSNSVFQTWRVSFEQIANQNSKAADMLSLMAVFDRQAIPRELLLPSNDTIIDHKAAIAKLKAFSLIQEEGSSAKFSLHRLVQLSTQQWLADHNKLEFWRRAAVNAVARACPNDAPFEQWRLIQDLSSHIQAVLVYEVAEAEAMLSRARILHCWGLYVMALGQPKPALEMFEASHSLRSNLLGKENELTLESLGLIGLAHSRMNNAKQARHILLELREAAERTLGSRHHLTLKSMSRLAVTYNQRGELEEGRKLLLKVLSTTEEELGATSEEVIRLLVNLTYNYNRLRRWDEAESVGLKALRLRTEQQGEKHPDTLTIMGTLAWTYRAQSRFDEAEAFEEKVLERRVEVLGPDHPKTRRSMANLAELKGLLGYWKEAEKLQQRVVEAIKRMPGVQQRNLRSAEYYLDMFQQVMAGTKDDVAVKTYLSKRDKGRPPARKSNTTRELTPKPGHDIPLNNKKAFSERRRSSKSSSITYVERLRIDPWANLRAKRGFLQKAEVNVATLEQDISYLEQEVLSGNCGITPLELDFLNNDLKQHLGLALAHAKTEYRMAYEGTRGLPSQLGDENQELHVRNLPEHMAKLDLPDEETSDMNGASSKPLTMMRRDSTDSMDTLVEPENYG